MSGLLIGFFIIGYVLIALEGPFKIDKASSAILTGVVCWLILVFGIETMPAMQEFSQIRFEKTSFIEHSLFEHLGEISQILFFLLGAMTIVELIDAHEGFRVITDRITTTNRVKLLWIISWITFFLSAVLDNLTTAIIMCALVRKLFDEKESMWFYGGFTVIAANAGGAWSPIGDVTTIMLWIGGQVTSINIIKSTILASLASLLLPLMIGTFVLKKNKTPLNQTARTSNESSGLISPFEQKLVFLLGCLGLLSVPLFKAVTHLPPYMGILLALAVLWMVTEIVHRHKESELKYDFSVANMLRRIDTSTILFFLGILLAVAALEVSGHLRQLAEFMDRNFGSIYVINTLIGLLSAIVDNVPLVAACMGMYDLTEYPTDHDFWELLAYCAGTGGSILIIGSAAGVAAMGLLKIDFIWYLKQISIYALLGYFGGIAVYYVQHVLL